MAKCIITKQCFTCKQVLLESCFRIRRGIKSNYSRNCKLCEKRRKDKLRVIKTCPTCGNSFLANYRKQIYCSVRCYTKLGTINPKGDSLAGFYPNDLEQNIFLGERFDEIAFVNYVTQDLMRYLAPENQIISADQYEWIQKLLEVK